jgi:hypothetical protein
MRCRSPSGPEALARRPEAERQAWQQLWKDVAGTLRRTFATPWSDSDQWVVKGDERHLLDESLHGQVLLFGVPAWADYDFEAERMCRAGNESCPRALSQSQDHGLKRQRRPRRGARYSPPAEGRSHIHRGMM